MRNFYTVLEVQSTATQEEIKIAYRRLAKDRHPDTDTGSHEKFAELSQAYRVLSDVVAREDYNLGRWNAKEVHPFSDAEGEIISGIQNFFRTGKDVNFDKALDVIRTKAERELQDLEAHRTKATNCLVVARKSLKRIRKREERVFTLSQMAAEQHINMLERSLVEIKERQTILDEICRLINDGGIGSQQVPCYTTNRW